MHVMVSRPNESRKGLLQSSIDIVRFLKGTEKLKLIRREKILYQNYFKKESKELNILMKNLFDILPEVKLEEREKRMDRLEKKEKQIVEKPAKNSELERLETDIRKLQDKINSL